MERKWTKNSERYKKYMKHMDFFNDLNSKNNSILSRMYLKAPSVRCILFFD